MGLKITVCSAVDQFWTKRYKKTTTTTKNQLYCPFLAGSKNWVSGGKAGYYTCQLYTIPLKGWADPPKPPHQDNPWTHTYPHTHIRNKLTSCLGEGASKGASCLFLPCHTTCWSTDPSKALPEFLVSTLVNFYWLGKAQNPGWYHLF